MRRAGALGVLIAASAALVGCPGEPDPCALGTAGADWIAYASSRAGNFDLRLARSDGRCDRSLTFDAADELFPSWSPSGEVAFTALRETGPTLEILDVATAARRTLDVGSLQATAPAFSPDGTSVAFEAHLSGATATDVYVVAAAGGTPLKLTDAPADDGGPAWSPDGLSVYFVSVRSGWYDLYSVPAAGGAATQLTTHSGILGKAAVASDGGSLAFARVSATTGLTEVVRLDLGTLAIEVLTGEADSEPAFDASGRRLAVRSLRYGDPEIVIVDLAGGAPLRLTTDASADGTPAFAFPGSL
jgi:TolB protein